MTAVGAFWMDGHYYFCGGPRTRKIRNIERNWRCAFGVAIHSYDVALRAGPSVSPTTLFSGASPGCSPEGGWAPTVAEGGFTHEYSAPSAGPPPWHVYEFMPENAYAVATKEPGGATRWTF